MTAQAAAPAQTSAPAAAPAAPAAQIGSPALMNTYARSELMFERGEGAWMIAVDGRRFLDFASGIAVTALGHCHPHVVKALNEQASKIWHTSNLYRIPGQERLGERLDRLQGFIDFGLCWAIWPFNRFFEWLSVHFVGITGKSLNRAGAATIA